ncbi:MAG TPA: nitrate/nitrite transporter [Stellaceae bacterium]|nr:nitrate/nitrite transporter [Stellaceae bacterium]
MSKRFFAAGHLPTLFAAFLYFGLGSMVWVLLGPLAVQIAGDLRLNPARTGIMVAVPVLAGAVLRIPLGLLADRIGAKRTGTFAQLVVIAGLVAGFALGVHGFAGTLVVGIVLGVAGASFAVALPLASRWYPPEHQGTALGIAGAGNAGSALAALVAPGLAVAWGWQNVLGLATVPLGLGLVVYLWCSRESGRAARVVTLGQYRRLLGIADAWWLMVFYAVTFGGFVGLAASLTIYFNAQFGLGAVAAGDCTAACVLIGSLLRPVGGAVADRIGGVRALSVLYLIAATALATVGAGPQHAWTAVLVLAVAVGALGMGNGAVFQLVPQRFGREIGVMTGLVGMAGGLGGFFLASGLGFSREFTGSYRPGLLLFALLTALALVALNAVKRRWRADWSVGDTGAAARI